jgi:hypothetical protein
MGATIRILLFPPFPLIPPFPSSAVCDAATPTTSRSAARWWAIRSPAALVSQGRITARVGWAGPATLGDDGRGDDAFCDERYDGDDPYGVHSTGGPKGCRLVPKKAKRRERSQRTQFSGT